MTKKYVRCLIYVTLICCLFAQLVQAQYHFGSLTYDKGLSNSTVLSICRDHAGFLWIGTRDGLNRYDGNRIKQYRSDNTDIHTISTNNYIYSIVEHPRQKTLWIGTQQGLNIYQAKQDRFQRINFEHVKPKNSNHFAGSKKKIKWKQDTTALQLPTPSATDGEIPVYVYKVALAGES